MTRLSYHSTAELPALELWLQDNDGSLVDFSSGWTFEVKIGQVGSAALLTKTTGITGAAGAGSEPDGTPNVSIAWAAGELALTPGNYALQLTATDGASLDRVFFVPLRIIDVIT